MNRLRAFIDREMQLPDHRVARNYVAVGRKLETSRALITCMLD
jgi:hypothetical protein